MQSLITAFRSKCSITSPRISALGIIGSSRINSPVFDDANVTHSIISTIRNFGGSISSGRKLDYKWASLGGHVIPSFASSNGGVSSAPYPVRSFTTAANPVVSSSHDSPVPETDVPARIKFKRPDKTARHIMQILDREAVEEVRARREIPDIKPGYIIQLKLEVPENKRRITTIKGIVIARRNAGLNTTFRLRRLVAGIGVESLLPLYSPNIKEIKVLDKKKVRRAKLYYLREKMNALRK